VRTGHSLDLAILAVIATLFLLGEALLIGFTRRRRPVRSGGTPAYQGHRRRASR
jgi:hypothetical protein